MGKSDIVSKKKISISDFKDKSDIEIIETFQELLNSGIHVDDLLGEKDSRVTMLHICAIGLKDQALSWVLNNGANVNSKSDNGNTALSFLSSNGNWSNFNKCLKLLVDAGVNFNLPAYDNQKAIYSLWLCAKLGWKMFFEKTVLFS